MSDVVHVRMIDGTEHDIPGIWIAGFITGGKARGQNLTVSDALYHWHWQWQLQHQEASA